MTYIPEPLRRTIHERAGGKCEYCLVPHEDSYWPHEVDHIYAEKHGGETNEANLCLSCGPCNRYKGSDLASIDPVDGEIVRLYHPRRDVWSDHFRLDEALIEPLTSQGRVTVKLLRLNELERLEERLGLIALKRYP
jgi:5-methylcytosine-specific restriction endonuclease McrA